MAKRVLCLDDDRLLLEVMRFYLSGRYSVVCEDSAAMALRRLEEMDIDMILSDFMLPEMTGVEFLALAREKQPEARRILISGGLDSDQADTLRASGLIHAFLAKPVSATELGNAVRDAFERERVSAVEAARYYFW